MNKAKTNRKNAMRNPKGGSRYDAKQSQPLPFDVAAEKSQPPAKIPHTLYEPSAREDVRWLTTRAFALNRDQLTALPLCTSLDGGWGMTNPKHLLFAEKLGDIWRVTQYYGHIENGTLNGESNVIAPDIPSKSLTLQILGMFAAAAGNKGENGKDVLCNHAMSAQAKLVAGEKQAATAIGASERLTLDEELLATFSPYAK